MTTSSLETQKLAAALTEVVHPRDIVLLSGEMGSGKTTFTQGFGRALGVEEQITSPTFVLLRTYQAKLPLLHVDVYRLEHLQEVIDLGLLELLDEGGVALIEWGDLAAPVLPPNFLEVSLGIAYDNEDVRMIRITTMGSSWSAREKLLVDVLAPWVSKDSPGFLDHDSPSRVWQAKGSQAKGTES